MESEKPQEKQAQLDPQTKTLVLSPPVVASSEDLPPSARIQNPNLSPSTSLPKQQLEDAVESHKEDANPGEQKAAKTASASVEATGTESNLQKKLRRAERFGVAVMLSEEEKRNTRAERFGTGSTSPQATGTGQLEEQKRKARAERFGITVHPPPNEEAKKKARVERFAANPKINSLEEEKRKARAIRFAQTSGASSQENVKDNAELVSVLWLLKLMFAVGKHMGVRHLEAQYWPSYNEVMTTMGTSAGAIANDM